MSHRPSMACTIALLASACIGALAQAPMNAASPAPLPQAQSDPPNPTLKPNPIDAMRKFEPPADEEYRLGKGDEITVDFAGRPDMQAKLVIGPDGRITLPLAGEIVLAGLTRADAAQAISKALSPYYANLSAQVTVTKYTANRVLVLGAVEHPGPIEFDGTPTLLEAVTRGGLPLVGPEKKPQIPDRCAIYRGSDQVLWVQLKQLIDSGNPLADLRLRRDDVIYIPDPSERFVSVLGAVDHPGAVPLLTNSSLASVIAAAGGVSDKAGNKPRVQIVDPSSGTSRMVAFNDLMNPKKSLEVTLKPGEIVYVPTSGFYRATYYLERLNPLATVGTILAYSGVL
ncbi:MAG: polysaccharide biosynthesis/export family protein [Acidobacteriota bacterium]